MSNIIQMANYRLVNHSTKITEDAQAEQGQDFMKLWTELKNLREIRLALVEKQLENFDETYEKILTLTGLDASHYPEEVVEDELLDKKRELKRRLEEQDYRMYDDELRVMADINDAEKEDRTKEG